MLLLFITCMVLMIVLCTYIVTALAFSRTAVLGGKTPWQLTNVICLVGLVFWSGAGWKELGVLMLLFPPEVFNHPAVVVRLGPLLRVRQDRDGFI